MRFLVVLVLCSLFSACENGNSYNRGYVISKSQKEAPPIEEPAE